MEYKVKPEDLKGEIKYFPIEIVQKMVERQVEQGNEADVSVFQKSIFSGFLWENAVEGHDFWNSVINLHNFGLFFEKYPKSSSLEREEPKEKTDGKISDEPHLLYSYENYKNSKISSLHKLSGLSERTARLLALSYNFNKTTDEEEELEKLRKEVELDNKNENFTTLTHEITDLYFELKNIHDDEIRHEKYELMGRKQCEIEIIKEEFNNK